VFLCEPLNQLGYDINKVSRKRRAKAKPIKNIQDEIHSISFSISNFGFDPIFPVN